MSEIPQYVLNELRCDQCSCYLSYPPILITVTQENICGRCVILNEQDHVEIPPAVRNVNYEIVMSLFIFPCRYASNGCTAKIFMQDMQKHEFECPYFY